jgi:hypothetical protein
LTDETNRDTKSSHGQSIGEAPPPPKPFLAVVRLAMEQARIRGNPHDYVILRDQNQIVTTRKVYEVGASLPDRIPRGAHVYVFDKAGALCAVEVREDRGETLLLWNGASEFEEERREVYPLQIPRRPTVVHRRQLREYIGAAAAGFWDAKHQRRKAP